MGKRPNLPSNAGTFAIKSGHLLGFKPRFQTIPRKYTRHRTNAPAFYPAETTAGCF
ncbi:MAG: hypothetical protein LBB72_00425 [Spirochaetaceae bacterium]|nr:hypothetical protein [Spirochaetaceae bacterium]